MDFTLLRYSQRNEVNRTLACNVLFLLLHIEKKILYMYKTNFSRKKSLKYNLKKNNN